MSSMSTDLRYVTLATHELARVAEIDRAERIDAIYVQHGSRLELVVGDRSSPPWDAHGDGEHSVATLRRVLENWVRCGATMRGSIAGERLVGQGYAPMEEPLPELFELEPEDIHMEKPL